MNPFPKLYHSRAFTLIELSIVLVIIGLIVGGVLVGRDLIRGAEVRNIITDYQKYATAVFAFRDKYAALPGDMTNATNYWGAADGNDGTGTDCVGVVSGTAATCNGDGDGNIYETTTDAVECYRAWQHLANAGMVPGKFSGVNGAGSSTANSFVGVNVPPSSINKAGFSFHSSFYAQSNSLNHFERFYSVRLMFGAEWPNGTIHKPALRTKEAHSIDQKIDDGKPGLGRIVAPKLTSTASPNCSTTDDPLTAEYMLTNNTIACSFTGMPGF